MKFLSMQIEVELKVDIVAENKKAVPISIETAKHYYVKVDFNER